MSERMFGSARRRPTANRAVRASWLSLVVLAASACVQNPEVAERVPAASQPDKQYVALSGTVAKPSGQTLDELRNEFLPVELKLLHTHPSSQGALVDKWRIQDAQLEKYGLTYDGIPLQRLGVRVLRYTGDKTQVVEALHRDKAMKLVSKPAIKDKEAMRIAEKARTEARAKSTNTLEEARDKRDPKASLRDAGDKKDAKSRLENTGEQKDTEPKIEEEREEKGPPASVGEPVAQRAELAFDVSVDDKRTGERTLYGLTLTYRVYGSDRPESGLAEWVVVVDAQTGDVLRTESALVFDSAVGRTYFEGDVPLQVESVTSGNPSERRQCLADLTRGRISAVTDPCGTMAEGIHTFIWLPADEGEFFQRVTDTDGLFGNGRFAVTREDAAGEAGRTTAADAHSAIARSYDFFNHYFLREQLGVNESIQIQVNEGTWLWNAAFGSPNQIIVGARRPNSSRCPTGSDCSIPAADVEVLGHEYTHALVEAELTGSSGDDEFTALNEGIADVFGVLIDSWAHDHSGTQSIVPPRGWRVGDRSYPEPYPRHFDMPSLDGTGLDAYDVNVPGDLASERLDEHDAGGLMRRAFYFLSEGVAPSGPTAPPVLPNNFSVFLEEGLTGLGLDDATAILYVALTEEFNPGATSNFMQMREAMQRVAQRRGYCSPEDKAVQDAWAAVNVGEKADRTGPSVTTTVVQTGETARVKGDISTNGWEQPQAISLWIDGQLKQPDVPFTMQQSPNGPIFRAEVHVLFDDLTAGPHIFEYRAWDHCFNEGRGQTRATYDTEPPTGLQIADVTHDPGARRTFFVNMNDPNIDHFEVRAGGLSSGLLPVRTFNWFWWAELDFTDAADGMTTLTLIATDRYGHSSRLDVPYYVDRKAPDLCSFVVTDSDDDPRTLTASVSAHDYSASLGSPVETLKIWRNGERVAFADRHAPQGSPAYMAPVGQNGGRLVFSASNVPDGLQTYEARCMDNWANAVTVRNDFVMCDPPTATISVNTNAQAGRFTITATARSDLRRMRTVWLYEGGDEVVHTACNDYTCTLTYEGRAEPGEVHTIEVRARDGEGRFAMPRSVTFTMPARPPRPCDQTFEDHGTNMPRTYDIDVGRRTGSFTFHRIMFDVPDSFTLTCRDGGLVFGVPEHNTECVGSPNWVISEYSLACNSSVVRVRVNPNCSGTPETEWGFKVFCARP